MSSTVHRSVRIAKIKYFTPPSTFDALWLEFRESANHMETLLMDFFMALSKLFQAISHLLAIVWEALEAVAHFVLTVLNVIWLVVKIILVLGEQIKSMAPKGPPQQHTQEYNDNPEGSAKIDSIRNSLGSSQSIKRQPVGTKDTEMEALHHSPTWKKPVDSSYRERKTISSNYMKNEPSEFSTSNKNEVSQSDSCRKVFARSYVSKDRPASHSTAKEEFVHWKYNYPIPKERIPKEGEGSDVNYD